jgi:hypothetical protein
MGEVVSTIFISVAAYREPELKFTIESAIKNAANPDNLYFGVYSQVEDGEHPDLSDIPNLVEVVVPASEALGPGYARAQVMKMFSDQDYFLQVDSHSIFAANWDKKIINLYNKIRTETKNDKVIISFWGKPYMRDFDTNKVILGQYEGGNWDVNVPHYTELVRYNNSWIGGRVAMPRNLHYHESACALGGFIFADSRLVAEVPYDEEVAWTGEEIMFSVRAYTRGWKIYSPYSLFLYHNYERHNNPRVWNDKPENWKEYEIKGRKKMYQALSLKLKDSVYGIGDVDLYREYQKRFGKRFQINMELEATKHLRELK